MGVFEPGLPFKAGVIESNRRIKVGRIQSGVITKTHQGEIGRSVVFASIEAGIADELTGGERQRTRETRSYEPAVPVKACIAEARITMELAFAKLRIAGHRV